MEMPLHTNHHVCFLTTTYHHLRWRKSSDYGKLLLLATAGIESGPPPEQASALSIRPQHQVHARKKVASSPSLNQFK